MDLGDQADEVWLLSVQRKLYQWSRTHPEDSYRDLWNWTTDIRNLRCAWRKIALNKGRRTAGVDGITVAGIGVAMGMELFLEQLHGDLKSGRYKASPSRRKLIPKPRQPGKFRPLGIPTVRDRVVQCAVKNILEPIFEAGFWHVSYGFRPGRGCHGALEHIRMSMRPRATAEDGRRQRTPYQWVIEGDIKGCFDNIDHHSLMKRVRARVTDGKVTRLIAQFLKSGVLADGFLLPTDKGTPQGGVISPLLANIALGVIEERYERWTHHRRKLQARRKSDPAKAALWARMTDRKAGRAVFFPIRYADDFVVLVSGTREEAEQEKAELANYLRESMKLELSIEKTRVSDLTEGYQMWVNPDAAAATQQQLVAIAVAGPIFSLVLGLISSVLYLWRYSRRPSGLLFLMLAIVGFYLFLGPVAAAALGGDFNVALRSAGASQLLMNVVSVVGVLILPVMMYFSGKELSSWTPPWFTGSKAVLCTTVGPWLIGTSLITFVYLPLPRFLIVPNFIASAFWAFAVIGASLSKRRISAVRPIRSLTPVDLIVAAAALVMVRLLVHGLRLAH